MALSPPSEASQGFRAKDVHELLPQARLQDGLGSRSRGRLATLFPARREDRIGELDHVGLPRAVLPDNDIQVLAKVELRLAKDGEVLDLERCDHFSSPNISSCFFGSGISIVTTAS
jgi:hypothetical protein